MLGEIPNEDLIDKGVYDVEGLVKAYYPNYESMLLGELKVADKPHQARKFFSISYKEKPVINVEALEVKGAVETALATYVGPEEDFPLHKQLLTDITSLGIP